MELETGLLSVGIVGMAAFGIVRALQYAFTSVYFSILDIFQGVYLPKAGVVVRILIPITVGLFTGWLFPHKAITIASAGCGLGAAMLVWPAITSKLLVPHHLQDRVLEVRLVLWSFIFSYAALGALGVSLSDLLGSAISKTWFGQGLLTSLSASGVTGLILWGYGSMKFREFKRELDALKDESPIKTRASR